MNWKHLLLVWLVAAALGLALQWTQDRHAVQAQRAALAAQCGECLGRRREALTSGAQALEIPECDTWCEVRP